MFRIATILLVSAVSLHSTGCGNKPKGLPSAPVSGAVNLDGQPMPEGEVIFILPGGNVPSVIPVIDGRFTGKAPLGANRVEIRSYRAGPPDMLDSTGAPTKVNFIPARFNDQTTFTAEVKAGGVADLSFDVMSE